MLSEEDAAGASGASSTFRSIFGDEERSGEEQPAAVGAEADADADSKGEDEDEEGLWGDDAAAGGAEEPPADNNGSAAAGGGASGKSMADWADDEDDEELWKDALQARVNQLELALQARAPTPGGSRRAGGLRRAGSADGAGGVAQNGLRKKRAVATDFIARNIQAVELRRSGSGGSASSRTDSPSAAATSARLRRKGSADAAALGASPRAGSASIDGRGARPGSARANGAVFDLSETEAIRRFVVNDIKQMSMERLVNNAKRLHFLEEFYKHQAPAATATSSTAAAAPLSPASVRSESAT